MSLASNNLLKTIYKGQNPNDKSQRMAVVQEINGTKAKVMFYGEEETSQKYYQTVYGVSVSVGTTVILEKINGNFIITKRVR